jgi:penicillin-binding protein 1C
VFRASFAVLIVLAVAAWLAFPPPLEEAQRYPAGLILRDAKGTILRVGLGPDDVDCRPVYTAATNDWIVQALVAAEDHRFFRHAGVDPLALLRAVRQNLTTGRRISGASTLTMQAVRLIHPRSRTWRAKFIESVQALRLERAMSKAEILGQYLNRAPFGSNLVGIESAARGWFNRPPQGLTLGEAAMLAGMVQSPTRFRPDRNLAACLKRRGYVLDQMVRRGMIGRGQRLAAERMPVVLRRGPRPFAEPWFCDWAQRGVRRPTGDFTTTLDPALQYRANAAVQAHAGLHDCAVALVIIKVATGGVAAMSCSGDYFDPQSGQLNTATTTRPAGSTLKPFVFAQAIDQGTLTPAWVLADVPRHFGNQAPVNFSGSFMGLVSAEEALILSLNLPALTLAGQVGLPRFWGKLHQLGLASLDRPAEFYGLGLALGNGSVSLLELANAYACVARGGAWRPCRPLVEQGPDDGAGRRVFSEGACWMVSEMLSGDARARDAVGHVAEARVPRFAWKTGTSAGFRDAWTVAWNPEWVVAVWCGDKRGWRGPETRVGKQVAAPLAWQLVRDLYPTGSGPWYARPATVIDRTVCRESGRVAGALCTDTRQDVALAGCSSWAICPVHVRDAAGAIQTVWPPEVAAGLQTLSANPASGAATNTASALAIAAPATGTRFHVVDGIANQQVVFKVTGAATGETLYWFRNDRFIGVSTAPAPFFWTPERGPSRFVVSSVSGAADSVELAVE